MKWINGGGGDEVWGVVCVCECVCVGGGGGGGAYSCGF